MNLYLDAGIVIASIFALWLGAVWVVESASIIARKFGMSELVIGLTVVAIATSAPEFAVTVYAAVTHQSAISVGNVVGSNVFNLGIILGIVALFSVLHTSRTLLLRDGLVLLAAGVLLLIFFSDLKLERWEGAILFTSLIIYVFFLIKQKAPGGEEPPSGEFTWIKIPQLIAGAGIIIGGAHFLVESASEIARAAGLSEWMIGITIVAAGTSTPELVTSVVAMTKGRHGISVGNLIGSDIFNMLGVLGVASILQPLHIQAGEYNNLILLAATLIVLLVMMRTGWKISRLEGTLLILIALFRWSFDFIF